MKKVNINKKFIALALAGTMTLVGCINASKEEVEAIPKISSKTHTEAFYNYGEGYKEIKTITTKTIDDKETNTSVKTEKKALLPSEYKELLLAYKNIHNTGIKMKRLILHKIYERFIKDSEKYKNYNSPIYTSIKIVILKMGIIGEIDKKYMNLSNYKLKKYYDYCYEMILYLLETENILKYKDEIKNTQNI